jgi:rubrerythrin
MFAASSALARAGGGGHFSSGGGGDGGGGSGGGGGIFNLIFWLLLDSHGHFSPFGLLILIAAVVVYFAYQYLNQRYATDDPPKDNPLASELNPSVMAPGGPRVVESLAIDTLRRSDPTFDPEQFYTRVGAAFLALQQAWSDQTTDPVRPFISDGILERFTLQFDEQKFLQYRNVMENVAVESASLVQVLSDHLYDTATLRIHAVASDYELDAAAKVRFGSRLPKPFTEYWSFLRKRGAKSIPTGLMEGNCPNCGAAVGINQNANCPHCKASLRSAEYDWVLVEITQEDAWRLGNEESVRGLSTLLARDPNFTTADLEDRVSVMFWRLSLADRLASTDPIRKIAMPEFLQKYAAKFEPDLHGVRRFYMDAGVGSVTTLAAFAGDPALKTHGHALVEICWSGTLYTMRDVGAPTRTTQENLLYSWYLLKRDPAAVTNPATAISSAHCPNCGAPLSNDASNACPYCNTVLTDGTHGWLLDHITPRHDPGVNAWLDRMMNPPASSAQNEAGPAA